MSSEPGLDGNGVAPIGLPAVVRRGQETPDPSPEPDRLDERGFGHKRKHASLASRNDIGGLRHPVDEACAVDRKRRWAAASDGKIATPRGFQGYFRRQPRV